MNTGLELEIRYRLLKLLSTSGSLTQREMARSIGSANFLKMRKKDYEIIAGQIRELVDELGLGEKTVNAEAVQKP